MLKSLSPKVLTNPPSGVAGSEPTCGRGRQHVTDLTNIIDP